jgi:hypothetical protein
LVAQDQIFEDKVVAGTTDINKDAKEQIEEVADFGQRHLGG